MYKLQAPRFLDDTILASRTGLAEERQYHKTVLGSGRRHMWSHQVYMQRETFL